MHKDEKHKKRASNLGIIFRQYFVAVWSVGIIFALTILFSPFVSPDISPLFLIAIMVSAWRGGLGAGLLATGLTVLIDIFIFLPPKAPLSVDKGDFLQLVVDAFAAVVVGTLVASKRKAENERKELLLREQAARIEAENANNVKDEFLAAVSHELRTPLTTIKTLTRILLRKKSPEDEQRDFLEDIDSECDRQIDLVHNLLDLSRIKAGKMHIKFEAVDVKEILHACKKIQRVEAAERSHQIQVEAAPDLAFVYADSNALRRVICTIMENAVKYTPDHGNIILKAFHDGNENVNIEISDNGRGIHEDDLPHIFESFYRGRAAENIEIDTREDSGVGLGLYIARSLVEAMNGKISVESRIGHGSKITIQFPVREQMNHSASGKTGQAESGIGKRIKSI